MQKIPGKQLAQDILDELKQRIQVSGLRPKLGVLLVGDDPASRLYVELKNRAAKSVGVLTDVREMPADTSDQELIDIVRGWNMDPETHGILIQLPLPAGHDTDALIAAMNPKKDVDGFHPENVKALKEGLGTIISPLHEAVLRLLSAADVTPNHAFITIYANSETFVEPLEYILRKAGADVTVLDAKHKDDKLTREADAIVVAVGQKDFLTPNAVRHGSVVIDIGINQTSEGKTCGDFDSQGSAELEGWYTPVPGGVGPMTIALLLKNVVQAATT